MMSQFSHLNWTAILLAFAAYSALGALWFTALFSKPYKLSLGKAGETLPNGPIFIVGPMLCVLAITLTSALLIEILQIRSLGDALEFSLLTGFGYLVANTVNIAINPNIPRPILYGIISGAYHLVGMSLVGVILAAMN